MGSLGKLGHDGCVSRDRTVTGHNEVTLKSPETGSFDEHKSNTGTDTIWRGKRIPESSLKHPFQLGLARFRGWEQVEQLSRSTRPGFAYRVRWYSAKYRYAS